MWGNISKHVGAAIQKVQKLQNELESQLDAAVGADEGHSANSVVNPLPRHDLDNLEGSKFSDGNTLSITTDAEGDKKDDEGGDNELMVDQAPERAPIETQIKEIELQIKEQIEGNAATIVEAAEKVYAEVVPSEDASIIAEDDFLDKKEEDEVIEGIIEMKSGEVLVTSARVAEVSAGASVRIAVDPDDDWNFDKTPDMAPEKQQQFENEEEQSLSNAAASDSPPTEATVDVAEAPEKGSPVSQEVSIEQLRIEEIHVEEVLIKQKVTSITADVHSVVEIAPISPLPEAIEAQITPFVDAAAPVTPRDSAASSPAKQLSGKKKKTKAKAKATEIDPLVLSTNIPPTPVSAPVQSVLTRIIDPPVIPVAVEKVQKATPALAITADHSALRSNGHDDAMPTPSLIASQPQSAQPQSGGSIFSPAAVEVTKGGTPGGVLRGSSFFDDDPVEDITDGTPAEPTAAEVAEEYQQKIIDLEAKHLLAFEVQRKRSDERVEFLKLEHEAQVLADKTLNDFYASAQAEMDEANDSSKNGEIAAHIKQLNESLSAVQKDLAAALSTIAQKESIIAKLTQESSKINEVITDRERALETSAVKMAETHKQLEVAQRRIMDLGAELSEKDSKLRQGQVNSASEGELKKQLQRAQEIMKEKEERLALFEQEGQNLAKKQSEMEKVVRTTKAEVKKRDGDIAKLKESKEQLVKAIEEMQDLVRKNELEASSATKSLSAMQAVSQASTDKLSRLEGDITSKADELSSQRRAMETAWAENNESKRLVAELRADRDDLRRQIGLGTSKVMETESSRRDIEQREAVLRATNKQLQDSLQRQMQESSVREERLRDEVGEMRKRWQEAITSRETLSSELGSATAPLLRQISSMQDSVRSKSEAWQAIEATLSERALRAESVAEMAEHRKSLLEDQTNELKLQVGLLTTRLQEALAASHVAEASVERLKKAEASIAERASELESRLALEAGQKQSFQSSLRELELRHKIDQQDAKDAVDIMKGEGEGQLSRLKAECKALSEQLEIERKCGAKRNSKQWNGTQERVSSSSAGANGRAGSGSGGDGDDRADDSVGSKFPSTRYGSGIMPDSVLPSKRLSLSHPDYHCNILLILHCSKL